MSYYETVTLSLLPVLLGRGREGGYRDAADFDFSVFCFLVTKMARSSGSLNKKPEQNLSSIAFVLNRSFA